VWGLFSYEDIFVAGIGFDIAGAVLLAKGLLLSSRHILSISSTYLGFNSQEIVSRVEDKVSTYFGVGALVLGFLLQLAGYALDLALRSAPPASPIRGGLAFAVVGFVIVFVVLFYRLSLPAWRMRFLFDIAHYDNDHSTKQAHPYGRRLVFFGEKIGFPIKDDESEVDYARRVWHVGRITEGDPVG